MANNEEAFLRSHGLHQQPRLLDLCLDNEGKQELLMRFRVKRNFNLVIQGKMGVDMISTLGDVFFELTYPTAILMRLFEIFIGFFFFLRRFSITDFLLRSVDG